MSSNFRTVRDSGFEPRTPDPPIHSPVPQKFFADETAPEGSSLCGDPVHFVRNQVVQKAAQSACTHKGKKNQMQERVSERTWAKIHQNSTVTRINKTGINVQLGLFKVGYI